MSCLVPCVTLTQCKYEIMGNPVMTSSPRHVTSFLSSCHPQQPQWDHQLLHNLICQDYTGIMIMF